MPVIAQVLAARLEHENAAWPAEHRHASRLAGAELFEPGRPGSASDLVGCLNSSQTLRASPVARLKHRRVPKIAGEPLAAQNRHTMRHRQASRTEVLGGELLVGSQLHQLRVGSE